MNADTSHFASNGYHHPSYTNTLGDFCPSYSSPLHGDVRMFNSGNLASSSVPMQNRVQSSGLSRATLSNLERSSFFGHFDAMKFDNGPNQHQSTRPSPFAFVRHQQHCGFYRPYSSPSHSSAAFYFDRARLHGARAFDPPTFDNGTIETGSNASSKSSRKEKNDKICGVCGDRALSYNFDAISCESCKAFFRRNAPKNLDYFKCPYEERCRMDVSNRRFCKRCRLKKCFEIGMRREYILSDEEKALKRQKIEANRYKMLMRQSDNSGSHFSAGDVTSQTLALRGEDSNAIDELLAAYKMSLDTNCCHDVIEGWSRQRADMSDLVNIAELSMRRVISMTKQVSAFRALPQEDQIQLLKTGSIELLILRSVITFDKEKKHFLDPLDPEESRAMKLDQLQQAENGTGLFEDHMKFIWSLVFDLKADETVLIILLIMTLFSSDRENIQNKEYVADQQERYCTLLRKYLNSRYPSYLAKQFYPKLIMKLTDIRSLNEEHNHVLLKLNPQGIQPLMKEVLDLCQ